RPTRRTSDRTSSSGASRKFRASRRRAAGPGRGGRRPWAPRTKEAGSGPRPGSAAGPAAARLRTRPGRNEPPGAQGFRAPASYHTHGNTTILTGTERYGEVPFETAAAAAGWPAFGRVGLFRFPRRPEPAAAGGGRW